MNFTHLQQRAVVEVAGEDRLTFLQGLISNDMAKVSETQAIWAGLLSPQGKLQYDLFLRAAGDTVLLDVEAERAEALVKRLTMFKLRSKLTIRLAPELSVWAVWGQGEVPLPTPDPRLAAAGWRVILPSPNAARTLSDLGFDPAPLDQWDRMRLALGLPDGSRDMVPDTHLLLELGFEELQGVDFQKGCYMGQETTARSKYRHLIRRRLVIVDIAGPVPAVGSPVMLGEDEAGHMASAVDGVGLAMVRLDKLSGPLTCGTAKLTARKPDWAVFPEGEERT